MKATHFSRFFLVAAMMLTLLPAAASGETAWVEWPDNPVVSRSGDAYYPSVLYDPDRFSGHGDAVAYKMWADKELHYFTSEDGIDWKFEQNTAGDLAGPVRHPLVEYYPDGFDGADSGDNPSGETMFYRLWYWNETYLAGIDAIHYAESPDGLQWHNNQPITQEEPLLVTGNTDDWNGGSYGPADVLHSPGAANSGTDWVFTLYYDGTSGGDESLGIAFSANGIHWIGYDPDDNGFADPVLVGGGPGDWDGGAIGFVSRATVFKQDGQYRMWYSGGRIDMNDGIGYAESADGLAWSKSAVNPIFHFGDGVAWRAARTYTPMVIYDPDAFCGHGEAYPYKMWFSGEAFDEVARIGYAVGGDPSPDCFDIHQARVLRSKGKRDDQLSVSRATFRAEIPDADDPVVFTLEGRTLVNAAFGEFRSRGNGYVYRTPARGRASIKMTLNFDKETWQLTVKDADLSDLGPKVQFRLVVGAFIGSLELEMRERKNGLFYVKNRGRKRP